MYFSQPEILAKFNLVTGNYMVFQEPLYFESEELGHVRTRVLTGTDGISDPVFLQFILQKFGKYGASGYLHDAGYHNTLEQLQGDGSWMQLTLTEKQANQLIDEALKSQGCPWIEREIIYDSLQLFGWSAFDSDRLKTPESFTVVPKVPPQWATVASGS